ncbi:MAG: hypothetical protein ACOCQ4_00385 [bacterium]
MNEKNTVDLATENIFDIIEKNKKIISEIFSNEINFLDDKINNLHKLICQIYYLKKNIQLTKEESIIISQSRLILSQFVDIRALIVQNSIITSYSIQRDIFENLVEIFALVYGSKKQKEQLKDKYSQSRGIFQKKQSQKNNNVQSLYSEKTRKYLDNLYGRLCNYTHPNLETRFFVLEQINKETIEDLFDLVNVFINDFSLMLICCFFDKNRIEKEKDIVEHLSIKVHRTHNPVLLKYFETYEYGSALLNKCNTVKDEDVSKMKLLFDMNLIDKK